MGNCQLACDALMNKNKNNEIDLSDPHESIRDQTNSPDSSYAEFKESNGYQTSENILNLIKQIKPLIEEQERGQPIPVYYYLLIYSVYYKGQWKNGRPHGLGEVFFQNGSYLKGWFNYGNCDGTDCIFVFNDESYYRGEIRKNKFQGQGKYFSEYYEYQGSWNENYPHGKGKEEFKTSPKATFQGKFYNGIKQGRQCKYKWLDDPIYDKYQGDFKENWLGGIGKLYKKNGQIINGQFDGLNVRNATIKTQKYIYQGNQSINLGNLEDGVMSGQGKILYLHKGIYFKGLFKNGQITQNGNFYDTDNNTKIQMLKYKAIKIIKVENIKQSTINQFKQLVNSGLEIQQTQQDLVDFIQKSFQNSSYYQYYIQKIKEQNIQNYDNLKQQFLQIGRNLDKVKS